MRYQLDKAGQSELWTQAFSNSLGWGSDKAYYGTIRLADVNGDRKADIVARGAQGIHVALSTGHSFYRDKIWSDTDFKDIDGWMPPYYSTTIQCGDINGDKRADFIGRASRGITGAFAP